MEKKRKYTRSSYKGGIGDGYYGVDARIFKSAEQRARVRKNLTSEQGRLRLLKNSNPIYWMLVLGQIAAAQPGAQWLGYNRLVKKEPALRKSLKHRIAHILRLDDRKYFSDKLFAIEVLYNCNLHHHRFLQDYIGFYDNMVAHMKEADPLEHGTPPQLHHVTYRELEDSSDYLLHVILKVLKSWDRQYEYPAYLYDFIDRAMETIATDHTLFEKKDYWNSLFHREHTLRWILFLDPRKDRLAEGFPQFEKDLSSIDPETLSEEFKPFRTVIERSGKSGHEITLPAAEFERVKERLFQRLFRLTKVYSYFTISYEVNQELSTEIYKSYHKWFSALEKSLGSIKIYLLEKNSFSLWDINHSHKDNLLCQTIRFLNSMISCGPLSELELEEKERKREEEERKQEEWAQAAKEWNVTVLDKLLQGSIPVDNFDRYMIEDGEIYEAEDTKDIDLYFSSKYTYPVEDYYKEQMRLDERLWLTVSNYDEMNRELLEDFHECDEEEQDSRLWQLFYGNQTDLDERFWLTASNPDEMSRKLLEGFHDLDEEEQNFRLELLYLSGGTVPDDGYYTTDFQFYLMLLTISFHWEEERYLPFLKKQFGSADEWKLISTLHYAGYSSVSSSPELLQVLCDCWSMELSPKVRLLLIKTIIECSDRDQFELNWWTEERKELLRSWIRAEEEEEVLTEVRRYWRYLKKGSYSR